MPKNDNGKVMKKLDESNIEEVIQGVVKEFGTSAHVIVGKKHLGKEVTIFVKYPKRKK